MLYMLNALMRYKRAVQSREYRKSPNKPPMQSQRTNGFRVMLGGEKGGSNLISTSLTIF